MRKLKILGVLALAGSLLTGCSMASEFVDSAVSEIKKSAAAELRKSSKDSEKTISTDELLKNLPEYAGETYVVLDNNTPTFDVEEMTTSTYVINADLDDLGRVGEAEACLGPETLPEDGRGEIAHIKPSGWKQNMYDFVDGGALYNRSHLLAHSLTGLNDDPTNLMTGTQRFNQIGMQIYENQVLNYIRKTGNHVMYRVTPLFEGDDLVARGVIMEGKSVEDDGEGISYRAFIYNMQPGVEIDYATGDNWADEIWDDTKEYEAKEDTHTYILNTSSHKIHKDTCPAAKKISAENRRKVTATREELIEQGYEPAGDCNP